MILAIFLVCLLFYKYKSTIRVKFYNNLEKILEDRIQDKIIARVISHNDRCEKIIDLIPYYKKYVGYDKQMKLINKTTSILRNYEAGIDNKDFRQFCKLRDNVNDFVIYQIHDDNYDEFDADVDLAAPRRHGRISYENHCRIVTMCDTNAVMIANFLLKVNILSDFSTVGIDAKEFPHVFVVWRHRPGHIIILQSYIFRYKIFCREFPSEILTDLISCNNNNFNIKKNFDRFAALYEKITTVNIERYYTADIKITIHVD